MNRKERDAYHAGWIEAHRKISSECYPEVLEVISEYGLDGEGSAEELADYICQIIKGMTAEEIFS